MRGTARVHIYRSMALATALLTLSLNACRA